MIEYLEPDLSVLNLTFCANELLNAKTIATTNNIFLIII
jgi:hypothetical protein